MTDLVKSIILGIVEGVTEFLPISSTGHLILCDEWMGAIVDAEFAKLFVVFIQIGAILAVVVYFWVRIMELLRSMRAPAASTGDQPKRLSPLAMVMIATFPVLLIGFFIDDWAEEHMGGPFGVAMALLVGGVLMIVIEKFRPAARTPRVEDMSITQGILVGLSQVLAIVFPGTSRSGATIMAGLLAGLSREAAAEFSFFLAIPVMFAACGYRLLKGLDQIDGNRALLLAVGTVVSFVVAWAVIAFLMRFIRKHSFVPFAIYRILLAGVVFLVLR